VLLLFAAVSSITAFVSPSLDRQALRFHKHSSIFDKRFSRYNQHRKRRGPFSVLHSSSASTGASSSSSSDENKQSYRISPEQLQLIKESADIVSVVESYGLPGFQRHGNNRAKALCPFHDDHNPSMSVDGERGLYKCFACGAGGDVFNFVREYSALKRGEPMTFYQAVRHVSDEYCDESIKLDVWSSSSSTSRMSEEERKALNEKKQRYVLIECVICFVECVSDVVVLDGLVAVYFWQTLQRPHTMASVSLQFLQLG
jgi:DNA primase